MISAINKTGRMTRLKVRVEGAGFDGMFRERSLGGDDFEQGPQ